MRLHVKLVISSLFAVAGCVEKNESKVVVSELFGVCADGSIVSRYSGSDAIDFSYGTAELLGNPVVIYVGHHPEFSREKIPEKFPQEFKLISIEKNNEGEKLLYGVKTQNFGNLLVMVETKMLGANLDQVQDGQWIDFCK